MHLLKIIIIIIIITVKQTPEYLLLFCSNYRHERKLLKAIIKKFVK